VLGTAGYLSLVAAAAGMFVADLEVADGQVTPQAGQDLFGHLQALLFSGNAQHPQQQYAQQELDDLGPAGGGGTHAGR
jgi:hypothetical protein